MAGKKSNHYAQSHHTNGQTNGFPSRSGAEAENASDRSSPTYNLKAVVNETGLKPDTLRAWERRYGLPKPQRTPGGHRSYSQLDVEMLKWLIARQDEGLSISRAVDLWKQIVADNRDPLTEHPNSLGEASPTVTTVSPGDNIAALRQSWIDACLDFDERRADSVLAEAFALFPTETVCFSLLQKGLAEIGIGWYEGRVTVQQEHFASALAIRRLETMVASTPAPTRNGRILAACPSEERHTFSLLLITLLLRRNGWDVVYLGANVPTTRLEPTLYQAKPNLVVLASQTLYTASTMLEMAKLLKRENVVTAFGGAVFNQIPKLQSKMPGHFLGLKIEQVPYMVEQLLINPPPLQPYTQADEVHKVALDHFLDSQASIDALVWKYMADSPYQQYLKNANRELGQNIVAALVFGDINLIQANLDWIQGLLVNYHFRMPDNVLKAYIEAYRKAAIESLDERGAIILNWLNGFKEI